jgi:hypothetical protein
MSRKADSVRALRRTFAKVPWHKGKTCLTVLRRTSCDEEDAASRQQRRHDGGIMRAATIAGTVCALMTSAALLVAAPAASAQDVRVIAPAPGNSADATDAPLTPEERAVLARALTFDPAGGAPKKPLRMRSLTKPAALAVNRNDKPDGSSAVAVKRLVPVELADVDASVGADVNLAPPPPSVSRPDSPLPGSAAGDSGSGAAWASVGMANLASVDARVDPTKDQGKLGGTLKHSIPVGKDLSVTLQDSYSVTETFSASSDSSSAAPASPPVTAPQSDTTEIWGNERSVKLDIAPTGTSLGAGLTTASNDPVTHNRLSADQKIYGPLHVTTAVTDLGETSESKSISAGLTLHW